MDKSKIQETVSQNPVVLFMKGTKHFPSCGFSGRAVQVLKACGVNNFVDVNVLAEPDTVPELRARVAAELRRVDVASMVRDAIGARRGRV